MTRICEVFNSDVPTTSIAEISDSCALLGLVAIKNSVSVKCTLNIEIRMQGLRMASLVVIRVMILRADFGF